ncbi:MAG TPA: NADPH:quinone reductase [Gemmata sp.]|nr:NADPH:quinone reductase [Gemmata sp.]
MKAAYFETTGTPDVIRIGDLPTPDPKPGEVLVKVLAASISPIDTYIRGGAVNMPRPTPCITGSDLAGVVAAIGEGVHRFKAGDRVWGSNQGLLGRQGTCAEYACVRQEWLYHTAKNVLDEQAAAMALVGITAHLGLFVTAKLKAGETIFVNGGTGGVGSAVVQMAKAVGARVITTVGSDEKVALARELGADHALNYKSEDLIGQLKGVIGGGGINVWYETLPPSDLDRTFELMALRGRIVVMAGRQARPAFPNGPFYVKGLSMYGFAMFNASPDEQAVCAEDINSWEGSGKLKALIGKRFSLAETGLAHQFQEENTTRKAGTLTGKIVILPNN